VGEVHEVAPIAEHAQVQHHNQEDESAPVGQYAGLCVLGGYKGGPGSYTHGSACWKINLSLSTLESPDPAPMIHQDQSTAPPPPLASSVKKFFSGDSHPSPTFAPLPCMHSSIGISSPPPLGVSK